MPRGARGPRGGFSARGLLYRAVFVEEAGPGEVDPGEAALEEAGPEEAALGDFC